jgi:hypothetical protein
MSTATKAAKDMTPTQAKEHLDELLEMQIEEKELREKAEKAHTAYKSAKDAHEAKEAEIMKEMESLNQELPLFDDNPEQVPWPFPLPEGDILNRTLLDVAADPLVFGLSIGIIKATKEKLNIATLGEMQKHLKAEKGMSVNDQVKAKRAVAKLLGPAASLKLLRAVHTFVQPRRKPSKGKNKSEQGEAEANGKVDVTKGLPSRQTKEQAN